VAINDVKTSSVAKGETLADTVRSLGCYADAVVIRHPAVCSRRRDSRGAAQCD
jgi:carbamoyl-phosphate synthase/aspartate carbamoyltransferase